MVGKSLRDILPGAIYLSSSDYDLTSESDVKKMYNDLKPNVVIHLSGQGRWNHG